MLELQPSDRLSAAEIAVAEAVMAETINPQTQTRPNWTDSPDLAQAYLDQLSRTEGFDAELAGQIRAQIDQWRRGSADRAGATALAQSLTTAAAAGTGPDAARMTALAGVFERLGA